MGKMGQIRTPVNEKIDTRQNGIKSAEYYKFLYFVGLHRGNLSNYHYCQDHFDANLKVRELANSPVVLLLNSLKLPFFL